MLYDNSCTSNSFLMWLPRPSCTISYKLIVASAWPFCYVCFDVNNNYYTYMVSHSCIYVGAASNMTDSDQILNVWCRKLVHVCNRWLLVLSIYTIL